MGRLIFGIAIGGALVWGALQYHVLRTNDGFKFVPKRNTTLADTYLDTRSWGFADWSKHPDLAWALSQNGQSNVMTGANNLETTVKDAINSFK